MTYASPTYLLSSIPEFIDSITYRMLADGVQFRDLREATKEIREWSEWCGFWTSRADRYAEAGRAAESRGFVDTAAAHLLRASLSAHYAQFLLFEFPEDKKRAAALKSRLFREASPLLRPPARNFVVPFGNADLPAYLRTPERSGPFPTVILVGGLDASKEDWSQFAQLCLDRGCAVVAFDGPGQGEAYASGSRFTDRSHEAISAVVDHVSNFSEVDASAVGLVGRSLGGYLAPRAASEDRRVAACVAWGALYSLGNLADKPPLIQNGYQFITDAPDIASTKEALRGISMDGKAAQIKCPMLVVHGTRDNSVPVCQATRLAKESHAELWLMPDSIHCCHDMAHLVRPAMADWISVALQGAGEHD